LLIFIHVFLYVPLHWNITNYREKREKLTFRLHPPNERRDYSSSPVVTVLPRGIDKCLFRSGFVNVSITTRKFIYALVTVQNCSLLRGEDV
jgi:hypothetical protein